MTRPDTPPPSTGPVETADHHSVQTPQSNASDNPLGSNAESSDQRTVPERIGEYRVERPLGVGGMGDVYVAVDERLDRRVAVKMMRSGWATDPGNRERFTREARAAAAIEHENIVPIYQVGEADGLPFLAMPLLKGESLDNRLLAGPVPACEAAEIGRQTAEGLAAAHAAGLVHRDIKPGNLFLEPLPSRTSSNDPSFRVRILDFGVARRAGIQSNLTAVGALVGTPAYMAPEQARGEPVDARSDLFSLGCVLYELTTGRRPFPGRDALTVLANLATVTPLPPRTVNPAIPQSLSELITRLLAKDPASRPSSARDVADELARVSSSPGVASGRRWRVLVACGLLLAAVVGTIAMQVIIRVERDGKSTEVTVPVGSKVSVTASGELTVQLPAGPVGGVVAPPPVPVAPAAMPASRLIPIPPPGPVTDFETRVEMDMPTLKQWVGGLKARGLRPDYLSARLHDDDVRFATVAVKDQTPHEWDAGVDSDVPTQFKQYDRLATNDYRMTSAAEYAIRGAERTVLFWVKDGTPQSHPQWYGTATKKKFEENIAEAQQDKTPIVHMSARAPERGRYYTMIFGLDGEPMPPWQAEFDLPRAAFDAAHQRWTKEGYRLASISASGPKRRVLFHAVWERIPGAPSEFALDLTRQQLDRELIAHRDAGFRPYTLSAYPGDDEIRFAVTWVPYGMLAK